MTEGKSIAPTAEHQRHLILDLLRGIALMGIALANFPEFTLWTFLNGEEQEGMPTGGMDQVVRFLQYVFVDGKFYSIFSILFGIGFSIILVRHGGRVFLRRMLLLAGIGFLHLMFVWSGDILLLYAVGGMVLMLLVGLSDKALAIVAVSLIVLPAGLDALTEYGGVDFAAPFYRLWWSVARSNGIGEENFATWLRDAHTYSDVFAFLKQGACERLWEFVEGHRLPKVLGLFIIGYLMGKHGVYARLRDVRLRRVCLLAAIVGLPLSVLYAWSAVNGHPWGQTVHSMLYATSVVPLAFCYASGICLLYLCKPDCVLLRLLAAPGRMALSCYIGQSLIGILLFYGIGLGMGTSFGLIHSELTAIGVFLLQVVCCAAWLRWFRFGPLEWVWRMGTYGKSFPIRR